MLIDFPDEALRREQDLCREDLESAQRRYEQAKTSENREEYKRALKRFADLTLHWWER